MLQNLNLRMFTSWKDDSLASVDDLREDKCTKFFLMQRINVKNQYTRL